MKGQFSSGRFRYSRESSDFYSEIEKMDTIIKRNSEEFTGGGG